mgnify:CR=1 FL=1
MKLVCVVGPTGCGKTWLGVELAKMLGGEVVSCDSMQIYRGMVIGTAAPTAEEMQGIPHHMVGVADPRENYSVARYADDAAKCVDDILSRGKQPVIVGGTGLYLNALLAGHGFAGGDKDGRYRAELESRWDKEGGEAMFVELRRIDPETAGNLHLNDKKRILRALEVYYETGKTMAQHNAETKLIPPRYDSVRIGLAYEDRDDMKRAIDLRVDKMVEAGLFDEVRALLDSGLPRDVTAMQAIGYKETLAYLDGEAAREEAIDEIKLDTLSLADLKAAETFTYDIPLPDGVDNLSGVTSVTLTILFDDIDSLTVDATQFGYENLTTERDVTVVTSTLSVTLRGTSTALAQVNEENLRVVADLTNVSDADGVYTVPATVYVDGLDVGAVGSYQVTVRLSGGAENSTEHN